MIRGAGNDIIEVQRIARAIQRHGASFLDKVFTPSEQHYCLKHDHAARHFAGRFAAKEAIMKALGTGLRFGLSWHDIEITNDVLGKPQFNPSLQFLSLFGEVQLLISISHCKEYATAFAIAVEGQAPQKGC